MCNSDLRISADQKNMQRFKVNTVDALPLTCDA